MRSPLPYSLFVLLAATATLSACGTKTPLTLPPGYVQSPLFGTSTPAQAATATTMPKAEVAKPTEAVDDNKPISEAVTPSP